MTGTQYNTKAPDTCTLLSGLTLLVLLTGTILLWVDSGGTLTIGGSAHADGSAWNGPESERYVVLAWSDMGTGDLGRAGDADTNRRPSRVVWAQVVERGEPPRIVTKGLAIEYVLAVPESSRADARTSSGDSLSGMMVSDGDLFRTDDIPLQSFGESSASLYQIVEIIVRDSSTSEILAMTRVAMPASQEASRAITGYLAALAGMPAETPAGDDTAPCAILTASAADDGAKLKSSQTLPPAPRHAPGIAARKALKAKTHLAQYRPAARPGKLAALDVPPARDMLSTIVVAIHTPARRGQADDPALSGTQASLARMASTTVAGLYHARCDFGQPSDSAVLAPDAGFNQIPAHGRLPIPARRLEPMAALPASPVDHTVQARRHWSVSTDVNSCMTCHTVSNANSSRHKALRALADTPRVLSDEPAPEYRASRHALSAPVYWIHAQEQRESNEGHAPPSRTARAEAPGMIGRARGSPG